MVSEEKINLCKEAVWYFPIQRVVRHLTGLWPRPVSIYKPYSPPWRAFDSWEKEVEVLAKGAEMPEIWGASSSPQARASSTQSPALLLALKPAVKGQSILCCLPRYLPFLLAKIPHWPPVRFPPSPLNSVALLQIDLNCLCVVYYILNSYGHHTLIFFFYFEQPLSPSGFYWD